MVLRHGEPGDASGVSAKAQRGVGVDPSEGHPGGVPYDPTIYLGAAPHYRPGRPPYSPVMEDVLTQELRLDGTARMLDVGCGPGILTVRLARLFDEVVGLDPDPEMLAEDGRARAERGLGNIRWVQAVAEDLPEASPGPYRLVTFGRQVDDRQAAKPEGDAGLRLDPASLVIRPAVMQRVRHARHRLLEHIAGRRAGKINKTSYSTHESSAPRRTDKPAAPARHTGRAGG